MYRVFKILFVIIFSVSCAYLGDKLLFDVHIKIYETLLTASGILFGVFGLWVSILYPGILSKSLNESGKTETQASISSAANQLLGPMFISLLLFLIMVSIIFLAPFIRGMALPGVIRTFTKCASAGISGLMFLILLNSIFQAMNQTEAFQALITRNATSADMKNRLMSGICRNRKK